jgi:hypothetical protein
VKSRIRTPSSALPACPQGLDEGRGKELPTAAFAARFFAASLTTFLADFLTGFFAAALDFVLAAFFRVAITSLLNSAHAHASGHLVSPVCCAFIFCQPRFAG